jgi:serine/threonine protein kinase
VLKFGKITTASDVWSFGICLWELFSKGETPYAAISDMQTLLDQLSTGYRLPKPRNCPEEVYEVMLSCWNESYAERPSFDNILNNWKLQPTREEAVPRQALSMDAFVAHNEYN